MIELLKQLKKTKLLLFLSLLCACMSSVSAAALMGASAYLITSAALHPPLYTLSLAITSVRFCGISRAVFRYLERYISHDATFHLLGSLRATAYAAMEKNVPFSGQHPSIFLNRLLEDIDILKDFFLRVFSPLLTAALIASALIFLLAFYSFQAAGLLLCCFLACLLLPLLLRKQHQKQSSRQQKKYDQFKNLCIDAWLGLSAIQTAQAENIWQQRLQTATAELQAAKQRAEQESLLSDQLTTLLCNICFIFLLLILVPCLQAGEFTGITLAVLLLSVQSGMENFLLLPEAWRCWYKASKIADNFFPDPATAASPTVAQPDPPFGQQSPLLQAKDLTFFHPARASVLHKLSFSIFPGEKIAILGESGCGKSTFFQLILKLWQPQAGTLYWEGIPYASVDDEKLRGQIQAVTQNTYIFSASIRENFQKLFPSITDDEIILALQKAKLYDFVQKLPGGLSAFVGENGCFLSGGQRQRLGIARALVRPAKLLLLDEPTASLDALTAKSLMETLLAEQKESAILLITHDWRLLSFVSQSYILSDGQLKKHRPTKEAGTA